MGKKKGAIWDFFNIKGKGVVCKYCSIEYKQANSCKMEKHIKKCFKCPAGLKSLLSAKTTSKLLTRTMDVSKPLLVDVNVGQTADDTYLTKSAPSSAASTDLIMEPLKFWPSPLSATSATSATTTSSDSGSRSVPLYLPKFSGALNKFLDQMDSQTNEMLNQSLAKAVFISGSPLSMVEHPLWIEFFKKLRPSYKLPSRFRVATTYLDAQYTEMKEEINKALQDTKNLHLQCDGWSNIRNESVINFVISKPEPFFVDFKMTKSERHNADYLAKLIGTVIENYGSDKFLVVIADNAVNMKAALTLVKEKYPHIVPLGCIAHLLHLLCSDILGCQTVKTFYGEVIEIVKTIKHSHILQAIFNEISSEKRFKDRISLKLPGKTRWGSHLYCLQSLQFNKVVLQTLAVSEKVKLEPSMKRRLLDDGVFWVRIEKMINLLEPIVDLITVIESNEPQIHRIVRKLDNLEKIMGQNLMTSPLQKDEEKKITTKFKERKDFGIGPIHLAAFLLDPKMQGSLLDSVQLLDAMGFICECAQNMGFDVMKVRESVADYRDKQGLFSRKFIWEGVCEKDKIIGPLLWWRGLRGTCDLADVAIRILSAPVTSAATERTFSTFSWIHSKKRNRLSSERAAKLTYLSYNWKLMNTQPKKKMKKSHTSQSPSVQTQDNAEDVDEPGEGKAGDDDDGDESHDDIDEDLDIDITSEIEEEKEEDDDDDDKESLMDDVIDSD